MVILWKRVSWCCGAGGRRGIVYVPGVHGPLLISYDPTIAKRPAIPYSARLWTQISIPTSFSTLCPIGNGLFQPVICYFVLEFCPALVPWGVR